MKRPLTLGISFLASAAGLLGILFSETASCPPGPPPGSQCPVVTFNIPVLLLSLATLIGGLIAGSVTIIRWFTFLRSSHPQPESRSPDTLGIHGVAIIPAGDSLLHRTLLAVPVFLALVLLALNSPVLDSTLTAVSGTQLVTFGPAVTNEQLGDFGLRFAGDNPTLGVGTQNTMIVMVYGINNFSGLVHLSASRFNPNDALSATISPENVTVPGNSTLTVTASVVGYFRVLVNATSGSLYHFYTVQATVTANKPSQSIFSSLSLSYMILAASILAVAIAGIVAYRRSRTLFGNSATASETT